MRDLEAVVDELELKRFALLGILQGCAVSIEYAVRHLDQVSALILISCHATRWRIGCSAEEQKRHEAVLILTRNGWADEFQRQTTSPENAVRFHEAFDDIDVRESLSKVSVPTIVFHSRDDQRISLEQARELAIGIPGARFVPLDSRNHILMGHQPTWQVCAEAITEFLQETAA